MPLDFSCPDWPERLARGALPIPDMPIDADRAAVAVEWFDRLRLPDVIDQPRMSDACGDWFRDLVGAAFGVHDPQADRAEGAEIERALREIFLLVPKKNAKTTNGAGLALTFMLMNRRNAADMLLIGPTQKISDMAFEAARGMIELDEYLSRRFDVKSHLKLIVDRTNGARLMVRTFGMKILTGAKPVFVLIDELHLLGSIAYAADVIRQIRGGMMPFPDSLLVFITTQSDHPPAGAFKSELAYARGVRDGRITEEVSTLAVLYEFTEAMQTDPARPWMDPENWHLVTPNLNRSITIARLRAGLAKARADGIHEIIGWASQHLNIQIGLALHSDRWVGADHWQAAGDGSVDLDAILARCDVAVMGIDGGGLDDLMGVAVLGRDRETREWLHHGAAWAHTEVFTQRPEIVPALEDFAAQGSLTLCTYPTQDIDEVAALAQRLNLAGLLPEAAAIGLDPFGVAALVDEMTGAGISADQMVAVRQGSALSPAVWGLERKLKDGTFRHGAQPLMAWCVGNATSEQRGNAILITKQTAGRAKIDPLVALFNACMLMQRNPVAAGAGRTPWDADPEYKLRA